MDTLENIYLREMSCELVGILIEEWLKFDNHAVYDIAHNNCQHAILWRLWISKLQRDYLHPFDVRVAKSLVPAGIL